MCELHFYFWPLSISRVVNNAYAHIFIICLWRLACCSLYVCIYVLAYYISTEIELPRLCGAQRCIFNDFTNMTLGFTCSQGWCLFLYYIIYKPIVAGTTQVKRCSLICCGYNSILFALLSFHPTVLLNKQDKNALKLSIPLGWLKIKLFCNKSRYCI